MIQKKTLKNTQFEYIYGLVSWIQRIFFWKHTFSGLMVTSTSGLFFWRPSLTFKAVLLNDWHCLLKRGWKGIKKRRYHKRKTLERNLSHQASMMMELTFPETNVFAVTSATVSVSVFISVSVFLIFFLLAFIFVFFGVCCCFTSSDVLTKSTTVSFSARRGGHETGAWCVASFAILAVALLVFLEENKAVGTLSFLFVISLWVDKNDSKRRKFKLRMYLEEEDLQ